MNTIEIQCIALIIIATMIEIVLLIFTHILTPIFLLLGFVAIRANYLNENKYSVSIYGD